MYKFRIHILGFLLIFQVLFKEKPELFFLFLDSNKYVS
jgi:hypothetical protein